MGDSATCESAGTVNWLNRFLRTVQPRQLTAFQTAVASGSFENSQAFSTLTFQNIHQPIPRHDRNDAFPSAPPRFARHEGDMLAFNSGLRIIPT